MHNLTSDFIFNISFIDRGGRGDRGRGRYDNDRQNNGKKIYSNSIKNVRNKVKIDFNRLLEFLYSATSSLASFPLFNWSFLYIYKGGYERRDRDGGYGGDRRGGGGGRDGDYGGYRNDRRQQQYPKEEFKTADPGQTFNYVVLYFISNILFYLVAYHKTVNFIKMLCTEILNAIVDVDFLPCFSK